MAPFQARDFAALDPSLIALARGETPPTSRFWWERTKGASKDSDLATCVLWLLTFATRSLLIQVGAADAEQAGEIRKAIRDLVRLNEWLADVITVNEWNITGKERPGKPESRVEILSSDHRSSHGARPHLLVLNELTHMRDRDFADTLLDNAAKMPHGLAIIATNAGHLGTWQWELRELARLSERWHFASYSEPAPWLDANEIVERRRASTPQRFARLWQGQWVAAEGDALNPDAVGAALARNVPAVDTPLPGFVIVAGLDLGLTRDSSALAIVGKEHATGRYRLFALPTWTPTKARKVSIDDVRLEIVARHRTFGFAKVALDPWQGHLLADLLQADRVPAELVAFTPSNLDAMARHLVNVFDEGLVDLPAIPELEAELRQTTIIERSNGQVRLEWARTETGHGDRATALMLALWAAKDARPPLVIRRPIFTAGAPSSWNAYNRAIVTERINEAIG
jgi:hypothetical protein